MSRTRRALLLLAPLTLFLILAFRVSEFHTDKWPTPSSIYLVPLVRKPAQCLIALAALFAPLPLCLAASLGRRARREDGEIDTAGMLLRQVGTLVGVQASVFFGLLALGQATAWPFLAAQGAVTLLGLWSLRRIERRETPPGDSEAIKGHATRAYLATAAALTLCGIASVHLGRDVGYDFFNYHYYNAHAFVHHREGQDYAVADFNTHFNPFLDVAYYLVIQSVRPVWVGFIVGTVHGITVVLLYAVALEVLGRSEVLRSTRHSMAAACAFAGACEPMFLTELGTTFHDIFLASFVLAALLMILRLVTRNPQASTREAVAVALGAGGLVGLAAGFKLTTAAYDVGLALILLTAPVGWRRRLGLTTLFSGAVFAGFLASNGYWMWHLYSRYGNPFFPFFNRLFKSPYWGDMSISFDHMSLGFRWFDHLLVPFYLVKHTVLLSEAPSRDARLAVAYVLVALVVGRRLVTFLRARRNGTQAPAPVLEAGALFLIGYSIVTYVVWYKQFRVLRYLVALKVLVPLVCVFLLLDLLRTRRKVWVAWMALMVLVAVQMEIPSFGRLGWKKTFIDYQGAQAVPKGEGIVLMISSLGKPELGQAISAVTTELPQEMRFIKIDSPQIANTWQAKPLAAQPLTMEEQVSRLVREYRGPVYLLSHIDPSELGYHNQLLRKYGLKVVDTKPPTKITGFCADIGYWELRRRDDDPLAEAPRDRVTR